MLTDLVEITPTVYKSFGLGIPKDCWKDFLWKDREGYWIYCYKLDKQFNQVEGWVEKVLNSKDFLRFKSSLNIPNCFYKETPIVVKVNDKGELITKRINYWFLSLFLGSKNIFSDEEEFNCKIKLVLNNKYNEKADRVFISELKGPVVLYECSISHYLSKLESGEREVGCPVGRIDVLTPTEVIEVKEVCNWREALGQVLSYNCYYPHKKPRLHLFGKTSKHLEEIIKEVCDFNKVRVTYSHTHD